MGELVVSNSSLDGRRCVAEQVLESISEAKLRATYRVEYIVMGYYGENVRALLDIIA